MMVPKLSLLVSIVAAFWSFESAYGAIIVIPEVRCHEKAPDTCVGITTITTPPPPIIVCEDDDDPSTCTEELPEGAGFGFFFDFVDRLEEGNENSTEIEAALNGIMTGVFYPIVGGCRINIGDEQCSMCSTCKIGVKYDCTNIENGIKQKQRCTPVYGDDVPYFYPLEGGPNKKRIKATRPKTNKKTKKQQKKMKNGGKIEI